MSKQQSARQERARQLLSNPSIKLTVSTWNKDSHGLYDYESAIESYKIEEHKIENSTTIYRDSNSKFSLIEARTALVQKNENKLVR